MTINISKCVHMVNVGFAYSVVQAVATESASNLNLCASRRAFSIDSRPGKTISFGKDW